MYRYKQKNTKKNLLQFFLVRILLGVILICIALLEFHLIASKRYECLILVQ